jgi:hypothetical protein
VAIVATGRAGDAVTAAVVLMMTDSDDFRNQDMIIEVLLMSDEIIWMNGDLLIV